MFDKTTAIDKLAIQLGYSDRKILLEADDYDDLRENALEVLYRAGYDVRERRDFGLIGEEPLIFKQRTGECYAWDGRNGDFFRCLKKTGTVLLDAVNYIHLSDEQQVEVELMAA